MTIFSVCRGRLQLLALSVVMMATMASRGHADGEPAEEFLKRLRAANYFDIAISYLDRLDQYPGVEDSLKNAVPLEKAQTYIDAAVVSRNPNTRDGYFQQAEQQLDEFLKRKKHPRLSEARLQLGKLRMVRAAQLLSGKPDDAKRKAARESYLSAAKTFDAIVESLRTKLKEMQGAKIDANKNPKEAALRDQYRFEFLQGMSNAGEARYLAARTFKDPGKEGKELLDKALVTFTDLSEKYDTYVQGAVAMAYRGRVQDELGKKQEALDSYIRMLEHTDADPLRDAKYQATSGIIRLSLAEKPPKYQAAIDRGQPMIDGLRPDERALPSVQELRVELAKAYLEKSKDKDKQEPADAKRAESDGRQLLIRAGKVPDAYGEQANRLLADLGIELEAAPKLTAEEDPTSLEDALEKSSDLLAASENLAQSLAVLEKQKNPADEIVQQKADVAKQLRETRSIAIQIMRRGLSMVTTGTDIELVNQTRQYLAYQLYQQKSYRDAAVVGSFLAQNSPGTDMGLRGGLLALNSIQRLLVEDSENTGLVPHLEELGKYLTKTWPDNPDAAAAQGVMITLALRGDRWQDARQMIEKMPAGADRAKFQRLMGQLIWNKSIQARQAEDDEQAEKLLIEAESELRAGLDQMPGELVAAEAMKAALTRAKIYLRQDKIQDALDILDHEKYGPVKLVAKQGAPDEVFASDLYSIELQVVVQRMTSDDSDSQALLKRAIDVMEKLRGSVTGPDAQKELTGIYMRMARDIREQLDNADQGKKVRLVEAFRVFLDRISATTDDAATLQWVGQTVIELARATMQAGDPNATAPDDELLPQSQVTPQAAELLKTAVETFERLKDINKDAPLTVDYQLGRAQRLLGKREVALDIFEKLLTKKPMMLDAQMQAALTYEEWAAVVPPKFTGRAYGSALNGGRPNAEKKNVIWGWGNISTRTSGNPKFRDEFFEARYHVALCRYLWGKAAKNKDLINKSVTDITKVNALFPDMGGPVRHAQFDQLLKVIQTALGQKAVGLPPPAKKQA